MSEWVGGSVDTWKRKPNACVRKMNIVEMLSMTFIDCFHNKRCNFEHSYT